MIKDRSLNSSPGTFAARVCAARADWRNDPAALATMTHEAQALWPLTQAEQDALVDWYRSWGGGPGMLAAALAQLG